MLRTAASFCVLAVAAPGCLGHAPHGDAHGAGRTNVARDTLTLACGATAEDCTPAMRSYTVHARAGETLTVTLSPRDGRVIIGDIVDPHGTSAIPSDADESYWFGWTVRATETGDFVVTVSTTETAVATNPYTLRTTVH